MSIKITTTLMCALATLSLQTTAETLDRSDWALSASNNSSALSNAIDTALSSRWDTSAKQTPGQFLQIDLGAISNFNEIELNTELSPNDYPRGYAVYASNNTNNWGTPIASGNGNNAITNIQFNDTTARYIKIEQTSSDSYFWWSIHDINIESSSDTKLDSSAWTLSASQNSVALNNLIDNNPSTRWTTSQAQTPGQFIQIDLGSGTTFDRIVLDPTTSTNDYPRGYSVFTSRNGVNWGSSITSGTGNPNGPTSIEFSEQTLRYIKIEQTGSDSRYWWSIGELSIYADGETPTPTPTPIPTPTPNIPSDQVFGPDSFLTIAANQGGFDGDLDAGDRFGRDHDQAGDINGDGIIDLIVGARSDDDGATDAGAAYVLFMNENGTVNSHQKISALEGGFTDTLGASNFFGYGVAGIGDYNADGIPDVAVSSLSNANTAIYILHLNTDGTVKSMVKNADITAQGLSAVDINHDGKIDLIAAEPSATGGGAIHILFFDENSQVISDDTVTIGANTGGFGDGLNSDDNFGGRESALLGDIDGNGTQELAVGAFMSDNGTGAIWILSLDSETYNVVDKLKIAPGLSGFDETLPSDITNNGTTGGQFRHALVAAGDLNGDGVPDLMTGAKQYEAGVGYILYLNADKTVKTYTRITETEGGFALALGEADRFSRSMSLVDDHRADGYITVNFGGGVSAGGSGSIYALTFQACSVVNQGENTFWTGGNTLFTNWNHGTQTVTGPLSQEQCVLKAFENNATRITSKELDGRCIIKDATAELIFSDEGSQAYIRSCP